MKKNNKERFIIDDDIIVTSPHNIGESLKDVIEKQQTDIDKLQSNVKFIYSYGGIGGNGYGGSGTGSGSGKEPKLYAELKNIKNGETKAIILDETNDKALVFNEPGKYKFYAKLSYSDGKKFYIRVSANTNSSNTGIRKVLSTEDNNCEYETEFTLNTNGYINLNLQNSDGDNLHTISQRYIVNAHEFDVRFMYDSNGTSSQFDSKNEYFLGDGTKDPFIDIRYVINIPQVSEIKVSYTIGDFVSESKSFTEYSNMQNPFKIYLKDLKKNGSDFLVDENLGIYKVKVDFSYVSLEYGLRTMSREFEISIIPSYLFINVRPSIDVLYDSIEQIQDEINEQTTPKRYINPGAYLSLYCKVYDGRVEGQYQSYTIDFNGYDYDENLNDFSDKAYISLSDSVIEQRESPRGISFNFGSVGIKKLVLRTTSPKPGSGDIEIVKYIYVKDFDDLVSWPITELDFYYKSNENNKYSVNNLGQLTFPNVLGNTYFEQNFTSEPVDLSNSAWVDSTGTSTDITTVISFGMQFSEINTEGSKILSVYNYDKIIFELYSDSLFGEPGSNVNKIYVPTETYDAVNGSKYHLLQICRHKIDNGRFADYLYIDGKLESCKHNTETLSAIVSRIVLHNVNVAYNLINLQYYPYSESLNLDAIVYRYWLAYRQRYIGTTSLNSASVEGQILNLAETGAIKFDGQNVIVNKTTVETIAANTSIPTMMFDYTLQSTETLEKFEEAMLRGYKPGEINNFGDKRIKLWWCGGNANKVDAELKLVSDPQISGLTGFWEISFQGTSTMANRVKNYSLRIKTNDVVDDEILFSPNFKRGDYTTFLPEKEWTIKADIADSAHANNTSVGKFVNTVCSKYDTKIQSSTDAKKYIKNTLEGFPVLLFFRVNSDDRIYFFGVYNFNMGRTSYYNLGYNTDIDDVYNNASESTSDEFSYSYGKSLFNENLAIGEVQENMAKFDFSQTHESLLFAGKEKIGDEARMFGVDSKITAANVEVAKKTLQNFVTGVAEAGAFCFNKVGKEFVSPRDLNNNNFINVYTNKNCVPDPSLRLTYNDEGKPEWIEGGINPKNLDNDALLKLVGDHTMDGEPNDPLLDYTSASEYFTICMALGLIDSILKNMNLKSWDNHKCYCAFYDMDCALGEDNSGAETVSYMAATDFWYSKIENGYIQEVDVDYDYWDEEAGGKGFDFTSSYLLAVIKYAKPISSIIEDLNDLSLNNYPQEFWAKLRQKGGELESADTFIEKYYKSGVHIIPEYLTSLNYKAKYLYKDEEGNYNAKVEAFNGSRLVKVKNWLNRRLHFLDMMFNVPRMNKTIIGGMVMPQPSIDISTNPDVVLLQDAFSLPDSKSSASNRMAVSIIAPRNTPLIVQKAGQSNMYILSAPTGTPNKITIDSTMSSIMRFLGSKEFINIDNVCPFLTDFNTIVSDKLENVSYNGGVTTEQRGGYTIKSISVKDIKLNIPNYGGELKLNDDENLLIGSSITSIDISDSGFIGTFSGFDNLKSMNISSVKSDGNISIIGNHKLNADSLFINGKSNKSLTTLGGLVIQDVKGDFNIMNTAIKLLTINGDGNSAFEISNDLRLTDLSLMNMKSVTIRNCPNLTNLTIKGSCESLIIDMSNYYHHKEYTPLLKTIISDQDSEEIKTLNGIFDFTTATFSGLKELTLNSIPEVVSVKLPNKHVKVGTMKNCENLAEIKTDGENSCFVITNKETFSGCREYCLMNDKSKTGNVPSASDYTKIKIDESCTDLSGTFALSARYSGDHFTLNRAKKFIESMVGDNASRITSLNSCFQNRSIEYGGSSGKAPNLSKYTSLNDVSMMYYGTKNVSIITKELLSLPGGPEYNRCDNPIVWDGFVKRGECVVSTDAFENISYRMKNFDDLILTIRSENEPGSFSDITNTKDNPYNIIDLFSVRTNDDGTYEPLTNIKSLTNVSFNTNHCIDFSKMFKIFPEVRSINNFLNCDHSNFILENDEYGMLYPCKKLTSISNSFMASSSGKPIDLWKFFDWENNTKDVTLLFSSNDDASISFNLNKTVSYENFVRIMRCISTYNKLNKLNNIFSNCKITNYMNQDISFDDEVILDNIKCINYMFMNFSSDRPDGGVLITRKLFTQLPNVEKMRRTFDGVKFTQMFTLDFFARRKSEPTKITNVYTLSGDPTNDDNYTECIYNRYDYKKSIVDMNNTFANTRFVGCNPWYNYNQDVPISTNYLSSLNGERLENKEYYNCDNIDYYTITYGENKTNELNCSGTIRLTNTNGEYRDIWNGDTSIYVKLSSDRKYEGYIKSGSDYTKVFDSILGFASIYRDCNVDENDYRIFTIIRYNKGKYTLHKIRTFEVEDNYLNFTHYVDVIDLESTQADNGKITGAWINHNLVRDYVSFYGEKGDTLNLNTKYYNIKNFVFTYNNNDIYPSYCILPPDMLYACHATSIDLTGVFSNMCAMGVIPRHFTSTVNDKNLVDVFKNVNVLPNVQYYYKKDMDNPDLIFENIPEVSYDNYTVVDNGVSIRVEFEKNNPIVIFVDEDGDLKRRNPATIFRGDEAGKPETEKAQFVYAPSGYSTSRDIRNTFNFRYNIPTNFVINGSYRTESAMISAGGLNNFHIEYYLILDDSAKWNQVTDARNPFIKDSDDIDYVLGESRTYYIEISSDFRNAWTRINDSNGVHVKDVNGWYINARSTFNSRLTLCGTKDKYTSSISDSGCPIVLKNSVKIDSFLSGNLVTFLCGRVFTDDINVQDITNSANKIGGSYVITMPTVAKNIILPRFNGNLTDDNLIFINGNGKQEIEYNFYDFMFNDETNESGGLSVYNYENAFSKTTGTKYITCREGFNKYDHA